MVFPLHWMQRHIMMRAKFAPSARLGTLGDAAAAGPDVQEREV
jgi:hypothetical protein